MNNISNHQTNNQDVEYPIASAGRRFAAAFLDYFLVSLLAIGFSLLVFINSVDFGIQDLFRNANDPLLINKGPDAWRIFLMSVISFIIYFLYFIVLPTFFKSYTIFRRLLKIRIISLKKQNDKKILFIALLKHSLLTWLIFMLINIIATGCCFVFDDDKQQLKLYVQGIMSITGNDDSGDTTILVISVLMRSFYSIMGLVNIVVSGHLILNSKKRALHDLFANIVFLYLEQQITKVQTKQNNINKDLPIARSDEILKELDKLYKDDINKE